MTSKKIRICVLIFFIIALVFFIPGLRDNLPLFKPVSSVHPRRLTIDVPDFTDRSLSGIGKDAVYSSGYMNPANYYHLSTIDNVAPRRLAESLNDSKCFMDKYTAHKVVIGKSWGTLPQADQERWNQLQCGRTIVENDVSIDSVGKSDQLDKCKDYVRRSNLPSGMKELTEHEQMEFRAFHCTIAVIDDKVMRFTPPVCSQNDMSSALAYNPTQSTPPQHFSFKQEPIIAIMSGSTTRNVIDPSVHNIALFRILLPSLSITFDCGYSYMIVIGYDVGDKYFDTETGIKETEDWFKIHYVDKLKDSGISVRLVFVSVKNTAKKPGPVFNEMARKAYDLGADFFYRVNDDTEIVGNWPHLFVSALRYQASPVFVGMVGPFCGNNRILTHEFTSRLHMEIFEMNYYPPQLLAWYMDDWISRVYGSQRTFISSMKTSYAIHHMAFHGTSYDVDETLSRLLNGLVVSGKAKVKKWMMDHLEDARKKERIDISDFSEVVVSNDMVRQYQSDRFDGKPFRPIS